MISTEPKFTKKSAKELVEKAEQNARQAYFKREEQRNQLRALTITVLVGIIGFALGKEQEHPEVLLLIGVCFCLFMHSLDTFLEDTSNRQLAYSNNLNKILLEWNSLKVDKIREAIEKVDDGNEPNNTPDERGWWRKIKLFFYKAGLYSAIWWWGLTVGMVALLLYTRYYLT